MGQHVPDARAPWSETVYKGTRVWVIGVSLLVPYLIVLLSFRPTRSSLLLRGAMVPLALWAMWEVIVTYNMDKPDDVQLFELAMLCTLSVTIRYAFTTAQPTFHALPRRAPLHFLRSNRFFRAFNVIASDFRHVNMPPNPPLQRGRSYLRSVTTHLAGFIFHTSMMDITLYPGFMLDPTGLGCPAPEARRQDVDLSAFCVGRAGSGQGCWVWFAFAVAVATIFAMIGTYHLFAFVSIGSGLYLDEEWPRFMVDSWRADSLNDLWGRRYHQASPSCLPETREDPCHADRRQMLRDIFILWAKPFAHLPRPVHILSVFLASAVFHIIIYRPVTHQLVVAPYLLFYLAQGVGCVLERAYGRYTGRRVGGWYGRAWMLIFLLVTGRPMVDEYYRIGWPGMMRGTLVAEGISPAAWLAYAFGVGQDPRQLMAK